MTRSRLLIMATLMVVVGSMVIATGCSGNSNSASSSTLTVVKPKPSVVSVNASTSGVQNGGILKNKKSRLS